jgi:hypothetical protein
MNRRAERRPAPLTMPDDVVAAARVALVLRCLQDEPPDIVAAIPAVDVVGPTDVLDATRGDVPRDPTTVHPAKHVLETSSRWRSRDAH